MSRAAGPAHLRLRGGRPGSGHHPGRIPDCMAAGVARFKWPERLEIVPGLPVTKVGKLDKKALRELLTTPALHRP